MKIEILGMGCPKCKQLTANAEAAVKELNIQAEICKVTDIDKITECIGDVPQGTTPDDHNTLP